MVERSRKRVHENDGNEVKNIYYYFYIIKYYLRQNGHCQKQKREEWKEEHHCWIQCFWKYLVTKHWMNLGNGIGDAEQGYSNKLGNIEQILN